MIKDVIARAGLNWSFLLVLSQCFTELHGSEHTGFSVVESSDLVCVKVSTIFSILLLSPQTDVKVIQEFMLWAGYSFIPELFHPNLFINILYSLYYTVLPVYRGMAFTYSVSQISLRIHEKHCKVLLLVANRPLCSEGAPIQNLGNLD